MDYILVINMDGEIVGKDVYEGAPEAMLADLQGRYPSLSFTVVDQDTFDAAVFIGPNYVTR